MSSTEQWSGTHAKAYPQGIHQVLVERAVPASKVIHAIADNYATHKHPKVIKWLADHPRWTFHFTPTSASWLNAVEGFFSTITPKSLNHPLSVH